MCSSPEWKYIAQKYFSLYQPKEGIILWCTHYPYIQKYIQDLFPSSKIIDPSRESAIALETYLQKHDVKILQTWEILFI
jgi:glutamate racemase